MEVLFIYVLSLFQALLPFPVRTIDLIFFHFFFSSTNPSVHLVKGRETTWWDEGSVQHSSKNSLTLSTFLSTCCSFFWADPSSVLNLCLFYPYMLYAMFIAEYMHPYFPEDKSTSTRLWFKPFHDWFEQLQPLPINGRFCPGSAFCLYKNSADQRVQCSAC